MKTAIKIAAIYALSGLLWIWLSDELLLFVVRNRTAVQMNIYQTMKGMFYVSFTALLLFTLVYRYYKTLNEKIRSLELVNHRLEQSNAELEQYAYIASHDLQEPLRVTSSLLQRLQLKYADQLDQKANRYIDLSIENTKRMRTFVQDLLEFSRVGSEKELLSEVNLSELVEEIKRDLAKIISEENASVTANDLPVVYCARMQMKQVLCNLIGNGIKYRNPGVAPAITIFGTREKNQWKMQVTDNGIGIEKAFHSRIFELFQRLHPDSEYTGTGIGLTIAKKIVEKWNGTIGLHSETGIGSTFFFTLPVNEKKP